MLEVGSKAPDFELPDKNGKHIDYRIIQGKKKYYISIPRIILQDVRNRHVAFPSDTLSLLKKVQLFLESVRILYSRIRDLRKNMDWHLHF